MINENESMKSQIQDLETKKMLLKSNEEIKLQNLLEECQYKIKKLENEKINLMQKVSINDELSEK